MSLQINEQRLSLLICDAPITPVKVYNFLLFSAISYRNQTSAFRSYSSVKVIQIKDHELGLVFIGTVSDCACKCFKDF